MAKFRKNRLFYPLLSFFFGLCKDRICIANATKFNYCVINIDTHLFIDFFLSELTLHYTSYKPQIYILPVPPHFLKQVYRTSPRSAKHMLRTFIALTPKYHRSYTGFCALSMLYHCPITTLSMPYRSAGSASDTGIRKQNSSSSPKVFPVLLVLYKNGSTYAQTIPAPLIFRSPV
jgi:hypothetical protein